MLRHDWVLDLDIQAFFDTIPHDLLLRAVRKHTECTWVLLYIERWLTAPVQLENGALEPWERGMPQGSVISPLLANLFLDYVSDRWMAKLHPDILVEGSPMMVFVIAAVSVRLKSCKRHLSDGLLNAY